MVNKINGFRAPYRSSTFRDQADSLVERSGLLFLEDEVYEDSGDVVIPPFKAIQHGLIYEKPDETRVRIVKLFGNLPKIELFARGKLPESWDGWGLEYEKGE